MRRNVKLEEGWYKDAFGPMLAFRKEDGAAVALLPKPFTGYWFRDPDTGEKTTVNAGRPRSCLTRTPSASTGRCRSKSLASPICCCI